MRLRLWVLLGCCLFVLCHLCWSSWASREVVTDSIGAAIPAPSAEVQAAAASGWTKLQLALSKTRTRYVLVDAKNGLGNRLRALASAMAFASRINRPLVLLWTPDLHCNCSFTSMFASPLPFALCESEVDSARLATRAFQVYNYMRPEPGAVKDEYVVPDHRHLFFKSAFLMNHPYGHPRFAIAQLQMLRPVKEVADLLVANRRTVGLHIRNVFDAPRDSTTINSTTGAEALQVHHAPELTVCDTHSLAGNLHRIAPPVSMASLESNPVLFHSL